MRKAAYRNLAGQPFPTAVRFEGAHNRLQRHTMKGITRLLGARSRVVHAWIVPRYQSTANLKKHQVSFEEAQTVFEVSDMKAEYDLSKLKARKNPYASKLKKPVTMRLSEDVVVYFKSMADEAGVPYQSLINLYLRDCLANKRKVQIHWPKLA